MTDADDKHEAMAWLDYAARHAPLTMADPLGRRGEHYARIIRQMLCERQTLPELVPLPGSNLSLKTLRRKYQDIGWDGRDIPVHFHPSLCEQVEGLLGFHYARDYTHRIPYQNEAGTLERFCFFFDVGLPTDTWAFRDGQR